MAVYRFTLPSAWSSRVSWIFEASSLITASRWSSRSLGWWPLAVADEICRFSDATCSSRTFTNPAASSIRRPVSVMIDSIFCAVQENRCATRSARDATTARALGSDGLFTTSPSAARNSSIDTPMPVSVSASRFST